MDDAGQPASSAQPERAGDTLRVAREAHGLTLAEVAARTRVPIRHLEALEAGDYTALPAPTYAVGFGRAYARAVGADEVAIAQKVRAEVDRLGPRQPEYVPYETADPARVPSRGIAIIGVGIALAVLVLVGLYYGTNLFRGGSDRGTATDNMIAAAPVAAAPIAAPDPAVPSGGQVSFVAKDDVWLRVYDADNKTLYLGTLKPGEKYDVPADANNPMINVGRPDQLDVTLNGSAVPPLGTGERAIKDVRVSGAAIAARLSGAVESGTSPTASSGTTITNTPSRRTSQAVTRPRSTPRETPRLTETQRANLSAAGALPKTEH